MSKEIIKTEFATGVPLIATRKSLSAFWALPQFSFHTYLSVGIDRFPGSQKPSKPTGSLNIDGS
jgi:hypothetical protein